MMAGVPDARFDAVQLYKFVTGRDPRLDNGPTPGEASSLRVLGERRAAREPLQYLLGEWDFMDFTLKVGRGVLCPRADSEVVCEAAIELLKDAEAPVVYDLCAGTGCLGLGIARHLPGAAVTCVEKSADAWPYLTAEEMAHLMPETAKEPAMALDGGADGLDFYRLLTAHYRDALRPGGWLVLEIGCAQAADVLALGAANGWVNGSCRKDYGSNDRAVLLQKPEKSC